MPGSPNSLGWYDIRSYGAVLGKDSTAGIQAAISAASAAGGGLVFVPSTGARNAWAVSKSLVLPASGCITLQGQGGQNTVISCTNKAVDCLTGTGVGEITIRGLWLEGPGAGTSRGIALAKGAAADIRSIRIEDVTVNNFGGNGIDLENPTLTRLASVRVQNCGGAGFAIHGQPGGAAGTSTHLSVCYANGNKGVGYAMSKMTYAKFDACAADGNADGGYLVSDCEGVTLDSCGCESNPAGMVAFTVAGGMANGWRNCWTDGSGLAFTSTAGAVDTVFEGCMPATF